MPRCLISIAVAASLCIPAAALAAGHAGGAPMHMSPPLAASPAAQPNASANPHPGWAHPTGQPNQSCANFPETPGNSASAPGSAFNPSGNAGAHYAGQQPQNSNNPRSVAQYDAACSHQP
jgi:hypothetical protein